MQGTIPDDPGIVDQDIDRSDGGFNLPDAGGAGFKIAGLPAYTAAPVFAQKAFAATSLPASVAATQYPALRSASEMAAPMPRVPPETSATRAIFPSFDHSHAEHIGDIL
jgi:hypothetical protein